MITACSRPAASQAACREGSVVTSCENNARRLAVATLSCLSSEARNNRCPTVVLASNPRRRSPSATAGLTFSSRWNVTMLKPPVDRGAA